MQPFGYTAAPRPPSLAVRASARAAPITTNVETSAECLRKHPVQLIAGQGTGAMD